MKARSFARFATRGPAQRFGFLFLAFAAFAVMLLGKAETLVVERFRMHATDLVAPVMDGLSRPLATLSAGVEQIDGLLEVHAENARLREQNARLMAWRDRAHVLASENAVLRRLTNHVAEHGETFVTVRVVGDSGGVYARTVLVNGGAGDSVAKGNAVVNADGLVGRVAETGLRSARVLLITDLNSRIPVLAERTRARAILAGNNSGLPGLDFVSPNARLRSGDRIVTSGHGGMFPPGVPVGRVVGPPGGPIRIRPFAEVDRLEAVRVLTGYPGKEVGELVR